MTKHKTAVLISGRGSNLDALIKAASLDEYPAEIAIVIANSDKAGGLEYARQAGIPTRIVSNKDYSSREMFDEALHQVLLENNIKYVVLAGFMRLLTAGFVNKWYGRMINIHPSLLPAFKGANAQKDALDAGVRISGCTVHFVSADMDAGPIIIQAAVPVLNNDTEQSLAARILKAEHRCLPYALELLTGGMIRPDDNKVLLPGNVSSSPEDILMQPFSEI